MTTNVQIRVDTKDKKLAEKNFAAIGLDLPTAFRAFLKKVNMVGGMPFALVQDSYSTYTKKQEDEILDSYAEVKTNRNKLKSFDNHKDLIEYLKK